MAMKKITIAAMICALSTHFASANASIPITPLTPEVSLVANMLMLKGSSLPQDEQSATFDEVRKEYLSSASSDRVVRLRNMSQALVAMNVTSPERINAILAEVQGTEKAVEQFPEAQRDELLQAKMKQIFQDSPMSGAEFSGCKLSDGIFGNLESIAFTGVVLGGYEAISTSGLFGNYSGSNIPRDSQWVLAGSFVTLLVSGAIRHFTCNVLRGTSITVPSRLRQTLSFSRMIFRQLSF